MDEDGGSGSLPPQGRVSRKRVRRITPRWLFKLTPPRDETSLARRSASIAPDLLRRSLKRIERFAAGLGALHLISLLIGLLGHAAGAVGRRELEQNALVALVWLPASALLYYLARRRQDAPEQVFRYALVYEVLLCAHLSFAEWWAVDPQVPFRGISWVCLVVVVFPLLVPSTPRRTLWVATLAASMGPLMAAIAYARGLAMPPMERVVMYYVANYFCACAAYVSACVVHRLRGEVMAAREMGSYRLLSQLGRGGMGEVWRAEHRLLARPAAVKIIRPEVLAGHSSHDVGTIIRRFEREARVTAALRSPHTVELYDFGSTADQTVYYVMELLEGINLEQLVKHYGPLPSARVIHLMRQACLSLAEAHDAGLIHRDIKPANLLLCRMGIEYDYLKVVDFGLVLPQARNPAFGEAEGLTQRNTIHGTPAYMPPELALSSPHIDGRADLYGLACVAYWLLTGSWVFEAESPLKLLAQHLQEEPERPSRRTPVPILGELEQLIMRCLAKEPDGRPASARELLVALDRLAAMEPWTPAQAERWWRQHMSAEGNKRGQPLKTLATLESKPESSRETLSWQH